MKKKKVVKIARRRRSYPRFARSRSFGKGKSSTVGNVLDGAIVGAVQSFIPDDALFGLADPAVMIGVGWWRKNQTLQTLGGYQLGMKAGSLLGGKMGSGTGGVNSQV